MESAALPQSGDPSSTSHKHPKIPEDTIIYSIFPDFSLSSSSTSSTTSQLQSLHLNILSTISPHLSSHKIWQHDPFRLSISTTSKCPCSSSSSSSSIPHLCGKTRFGDNLDDEWFIVFLLFQISSSFPSLTARASDSDGEFLLIESAFSLPRWLTPATSTNRVFIRNAALHIIPKTLSNPSLLAALRHLSRHPSPAPDAVQSAIQRRISIYPTRSTNHRIRVRVPARVAHVLIHEPCLISLAVEGFYDRDVDSMKYAAKMEMFGGGSEEMVRVSIEMSRAMYAQLLQQNFQAPRCYWMPERRDGGGVEYKEAEMGMKIACGMEMMYQQRRKEGLDGKGSRSTWEVYKESLERSGYFDGVLVGSMEYRRRMENALDYYRKSSVFSQTR